MGRGKGEGAVSAKARGDVGRYDPARHFAGVMARRARVVLAVKRLWIGDGVVGRLCYDRGGTM
ncbi:hypothetical protein [Cypionkella aquatica]|uniref:hypothetical protein n=1 Tax=Cypionkella aquatica TaxID=1756042 RepID=UPI0024E0845D|nr:hypothetical protein [Cypionkella aquatica]